jgi:hypothetical protein
VRYEIYNECDIDWKLQGKIHTLLNRTYTGSESFITKTFAYRQPDFRVLAFNNEDLVGLHAGFFPINLLLPEGKVIQAGGVGLFAVEKQPGLSRVAVELYKRSVAELKKSGVETVLTITSNSVVERMSKKFFLASILDMPVRGSAGYSKRTDKIVVIQAVENSNQAKVIEKAVLEEGQLKIKGELF